MHDALNTRQPIAIVGIGCRFPGGVNSPNELRQFLAGKRTGIVTVPPDRWDSVAFYHPDFTKPGRIHATRGGFISEIDRFDAGFFGISPHEAARMDPQQRLILETTFRAIEDAGIRLDQLAGTRVAVIVGCSTQEYNAIQITASERERIGPSTNPASALSIVSNRVSYLFDLRGPSFTVDTACSSSLTAVHLACRAIWDESADAALVGGVNAVLRPETTMGFSKGSYLSPDGECRAFSDDANGYVRSEGCGVVFLKPLADAVANGDRIYALIRGSWINQDGRTRGMTLPSREAQEALLERAYRDANVDPSQVCFIEAHGTGTPAGDPIEAAAIGSVVGRHRPESGSCLIGSIKTNIGHLESAAGMAGIIKLALTMQTRVVFPNRNFRAPNPAIPFEQLRLRVPTEVAQLGDGPLYGGVNAFGFGGANAHIVLESPPSIAPALASTPTDQDGQLHTLLFSARSKSSLQATAKNLADVLERQSVPPADLAAALATRRSRFEHRAAVRGTGRVQLADELRRFSETGESTDSTLTGRITDNTPSKIAFIFSGQGPQWWGMGRHLLDHNPIFQEAVHEIDVELSRLGWLRDEGSSLCCELQKTESTSRMAETRIAQPAIFAVQMGLTAVLHDRGVTPQAVLGHSIGEIAAAVTSGCLTLAEGARIVYHRSHSQAAAEGCGLMAAVGLSEEETNDLLNEYGGQVEVAAINGPNTVTVAGTAEGVQRLIIDCDRRNIFVRRLNISVPFHCFLMNPIEDRFRTSLGSLSPCAGRIPFFSSVTTGQLRGEALTSDYWWQNIRKPVRFYSAFNELLSVGIKRFIELGPHPILKRDADDAISKRALPAKVLPSLNRSDTDDLSVACLLQQLWTQGFSCVPPSPQKNGITELPFYPFERQPYWNESLASQEARRRPNREKHPHVAELRPSVKSADVFAAELSFDQHAEPYLADHIVQGVIVVPAAAQIETLLNTADLAATSPDSPRSILEDVEFRRAITLPDDADSVDIQLDVYSDQGYFRIASRRRTDKSHEWLEHTRGRLNRIDGQRPLSSISLHSIRERLKNCIPAGVVFQSLLEMGLKLGPSFQGITEVWVDGREALSRIQLPAALRADSERFKFHPAVLDCMLQTAAVNGLCRESTSRIVIDGSLFLPHRAGRIELYRSPGVEPFWCHSILERKLDDEFEVSVWAYDETGKPLAALEELIARRVPGSPAVAATGNNVLYDHIWQASDAVEADRGSIAGTWMVLANERDCAISNAIIEAISTHCAGVIVCRTGDAFQRVARNEYHVRPCNPTDFSLVLQNAGDEARICGVVNLWMCRTEIDEAAIEAATHLGPAAITYLIQSLDDAAQWESDHPKVCLVTLGAQSVELTDAGSLCPPSALLTGFGRVLTSERPGLKILVVDLSRVPGAPEIANLISELLGNHPYQELALRDGRRYVKSIKARVQNSPQATNFDVESTPLALNIKTPGSLDSISWEEQRQCVPGLDEIEIAVKSCGLNFKDVALATGLVSGAVFARGHTQGQIGMDCAGIVSRVGTKVTTLRVGDHVMGIARGALANRVIADAHHVVRMPTSLTFSEAAGIPLVFLTAKLALERLARIEPDEVVLIHAAAGGVGLAAVQFVHRRGGKVIATAGSPTKVDFLKTLGVSHVFDSRKEDFREKVMEVTGGRGADVVLNSLSGRSLIQGLRSLASFGRFIEIGKVDIVENRQLALQQFAENRSYFCLDVDQWLVGKKREVQQVLAECAADLEANRLRCLPVTKFGIEQTADAFRYLAEARQIGKVVIDIPGAGTVQAIPSPLRRLDETGWYIVSGGTRGYGFAAASWLVDRGVKNLALLSRRGIEGATESGQVESLIQMGINIVALQCDVSDHQAVTSVCDDLRRSKPIHGIIHAATVLDDAPISFLNHDRFASVIRSKASGAWNLHVATRTDNIKFYLMFSSISSVVGTPGQANYAAANAYLDTFVHYLRGLGIPAFVINWGVLDDIGMVSRASIEQRQKILNQGIKAFGQSEVFRLLETIVASDSPSVIAARIDWNSPNSDWLINRFPGIRENSASRAANAKDSDSVSLHERLRVAQPESHADILASAIFNIATKLTGAPSEEIDLELRLDRMGMDSLNAVQLSSWIEQALGLAIPVVQIMRGPSSSELARTLLARIKPAIEADSDRCSPQNNSKSLLRCWRRNPDAAWRILCFPYSGGTGDVFAAWADIVPADAEVWSIDLPTFDGPDGAVLQLPTEEVYAWVAGELQSYFDRSVVFYGHSVGAWFAVEVARHLRATSGLEPELLALGGLLTPDAIRSLVPTNGDHLISDSAVNSAMRMLQYQDVLLTDSIATSQMKELMRRDLWLGSRQDLSKLRVPENVPLLIFGGSDDPLPTIEKDIAAHTTAPTGIQIESVRGGHLFVDDALARAHIVRTIVARIATQSKANTIYGGSRT